MTIRNTYSSESWDKVYNAFQQINFTAYDYDTVKESLLQYLKIYHAEDFNDFIESGELIAILEMFAYVAELLAYRVDVMSHENFMPTAQRKQSILKLARLISYRASRNIPARGLVKITTVRTSEQIFDSLGNDLANVTVTWNDPNNSNWKEQFFLVMNKVMTSRFGQPQKSFQIGDVMMQVYSLNNSVGGFKNGVFAFTAGGQGESFPMEVVPVDVDENGPFERNPDLNAQLSIAYASDGRGDGSDYTGFLMFVKQGTLIRTDYTIEEAIKNRRIELDLTNVNDTDVWVYRIENDTISENWKRVETINEQNLQFNNDNSTRKKFEIETLENDRVALLFGDGDFSDAPVGDFQLWARVSANETINIAKNQVQNARMSFTYVNQIGASQSASLTFSLTSALQNNAASEDIEHIRQAAPATYYGQNRMVNGQDYNTYMLKDQSILKLKTVNRTFAGQPKYIEWNDSSRKYENVKLFGDDLKMFYDIHVNNVTSTSSARSLIDSYLEPLLTKTGVFNMINYVSASHPDAYGIMSFPRRAFIEDNRSLKTDGTPRFVNGIDGGNANPYGDLVTNSSPMVDGSLKEKTAIQGALDRHWYGEPKSFVTLNGARHGVIDDPTTSTSTNDGKLYDESLRRTIDGVNTWPPGDTGSGLQSIANEPYFGLKWNRFLKCVGSPDINLISSFPNGLPEYKDRVEVFTLEVQTDKTTVSVVSNLRGSLPSARVGVQYSSMVSDPPIDFLIPAADEEAGEVPFEQGDAFIVEVYWTGLAHKLDDPEWRSDSSSFAGYTWVNRLREFNGETKINLNGYFEIISHDAISVDPFDQASWSTQHYRFDPSDDANAWIFLIKRTDDSFGNPLEYTIYYREMRLIVESATTKFWYNQSSQIIDPETKKTVYDKIRILRSNLDSDGRPLRHNHVYDVVGSIYDNDGNVVTSQLEVLPANSLAYTISGTGVIDNMLQYEHFSADSFEFGIVENGSTTWLPCGSYIYTGGYDIDPFDTIRFDTGRLIILSGPYAGLDFEFSAGQFFTETGANPDGKVLVRRRSMPIISHPDGTCSADTGLDFMWQHFSPVTNLIDPSVTNIHDAFILSRGYYQNMNDYIRGVISVEPTPPTPLELRTSYAELLKNKMLSDTLVLHSGKIKLLFGALADPQLRAKFRIVKAQGATFSDERIKAEVIAVINSYFNIANWDFGDKFYATELISLIHQRLPTQIASVVPVPTYSVNSFGSLFTVDSGFDEVLQSCATVNDVEIVAALTPTVLRQMK
jgi:hypothetical protein